MHGMHREQLRKDVPRLLEMADLTVSEKTRICKYSKGIQFICDITYKLKD